MQVFSILIWLFNPSIVLIYSYSNNEKLKNNKNPAKLILFKVLLLYFFIFILFKYYFLYIINYLYTKKNICVCLMISNNGCINFLSISKCSY